MMKRKSLAIFLIIISGVHISSAIEMKGVSYTAWSEDALFTEDSDISLANARAIGCNWVAICVWWFQDNINSTVIEPDYTRYSAEPNSVVHAINRCHELGMKVMLKPMVDCRDGSWRGNINPSTDWFSAYQDFANFWADIAQDNKVEMFCIGCELVNTLSWTSSWRNIIQGVRTNHYSGPITYAANHGQEQNINWWDELDYIGIDAYYSLTSKNDPTLAELKTAWNNRCNSIETWRNSNWPSMDIIFTEVGYQSVDGTNKTPWWTDPGSNPIDLQEQADCYKALLSQCKGRSWWLGAFWWNWETDPDAGGPENPYHPMQNKPAELVLYHYYTIFVDAGSPNNPGTGTFNDPFRKIQDAIDAAIGGDIIEIQPGLYTGPGNYDLDPNGLAITVRSTEPNDPNVVANTIIDPNGAGRGFNFQGGEDANCVISGLTIRNGYTGGYGANVYCYHSSPTIRNCTIKNGHAAGEGGGLYCDSCNPKIINSTITGNWAGFYGGGVSCYYSNPEIVGCTISDNNAVSEGGGFDLVSSSATLLNCIISNNKAASSGGMNCYSPSEPNLVNCTLTRNVATDSGGGLFCQDGSSVTIKNSIFWANEAAVGPQVALDATSSVSISYSDVQDGWTGGTGNIDADPCFASFESNGDANMWDFHLQSAYGRWDPNGQSWVTDSNTSPCIDAGDPNSDWSNEPWPNGKHINMGAYGGTNQASMNGNPADFDIDGSVNFVDFAEFSNKWFTKESCIQDLVSDGVVDFADLGVFAENWLWQRE